MTIKNSVSSYLIKVVDSNNVFDCRLIGVSMDALSVCLFNRLSAYTSLFFIGHSKEMTH